MLLLYISQAFYMYICTYVQFVEGKMVNLAKQTGCDCTYCITKPN